jgi:D-tyrosyl-tRNA(Tyr) deacylase
MRALIQRVTSADVAVEDEIIAKIGNGLLVLLCAVDGDGEAEAETLANKIAKLRIFADEAGKMNRSVIDVGGEVLLVSQFTLAADTRKGNRPSFIKAAAPDQAIPLLDHFKARLEANGLTVATGRFGAEMKVGLVNDGPVTIWLDTAT